MNLEFTTDELAFQTEVQEFLGSALPEHIREAAERTPTVFVDKDIAMEWQAILVDKGWAVPSWPVEWGGVTWSPTKRYIFNMECYRAGAPMLIPLGLGMLAPVLLAFGTDAQREEYLPKMLSGEHYWCQGYSEPGSGSDLASLKLKADNKGDHYLVNGSKLWQTHAQFADHIFCLVRTDRSGKPQQGISFLLIAMDTPGVSVEPIITMAGDHEVNQVFFDEVRVPQANRLGEEDDGWTVAKYLLEFERGGAGAISVKIALDRLAKVATTEAAGDGARLIDDANFRRKLSSARIEIEAVEMTERRIMAALSNGQNPGPASSQLKLRGTEIKQLVDELAVEAIAHYALPLQKEARTIGSNIEAIGPAAAITHVPSYLNNRAATIYGGSSEVQRGIMAKFVLGL